MRPDTGVRLGDVHLHAYYGHPTDEHGVQWGLTKLEGWFDGWTGAGGVDQRSQADGAWVSPQYAGPRVIHVDGRFEAPSWDAATAAWDRLLGGLPFRQLGTLRVSTGEGLLPEQTALVRQHEKPLLNRRANRASFSLSLLAPDPRKYDAASRSASLVLPNLSGGIAPDLTPPFVVTGTSSLSQATLTNDGNTTTYPTILVAGPCPPATLVNLTTSEALRVMDPIPAGQTLVIDVLNHTATISGQSRRVLGTWWGLAPGANEVSFSASGYDSSASMSISFRSAWK